MMVAFRRHTLLPPDDCLNALQVTIPNLTCSALYRCLQLHSISRSPGIASDKSAKQMSKAYSIGYFIDIADVRTAEGKRQLYVDIAAHQSSPSPSSRQSRSTHGSGVPGRLERFSADLNRWGFPAGRFSDSGSVLAKEAGMDGSSLIA